MSVSPAYDRVATLTGHIDSVLRENAVVVGEAERYLSGTAYMTALHAQRRQGRQRREVRAQRVAARREQEEADRARTGRKSLR